MGQKLDTPKDFIKALAMDFSLWVLIISHISIIGLVWYDGWHPLTLIWIYISQQLVQSLMDIFLLLYNPNLDVTGLQINGKQATDSKRDRKQSSTMVLMMLFMIVGIISFFTVSGMGIRKGTLPLLLTSTSIFAFQKLFSYFYIRLMDGPPKINMGCLIIGPLSTVFFLFALFFFGQLVFNIQGDSSSIENHLSLANLLFLGFFLALKLLLDIFIYIAQKYGTNAAEIYTNP